MVFLRIFYKLFFVGVIFVFIVLSASSVYAVAPTWQSSSGASGKSTGTSIATPSGTQVGDLLILHIIYEKGTEASATNPEFTTIRTDNSTNKVGQRIAYRIHDGGSLGSFTINPSGEWTYSISRITGFNSNDPIDVHNGANGVSGNPNPPSITTTVKDTLVFIMAGNVKPSTYTPPSNYTERYERTNKFSNWGATRSLSSATTENPGEAVASQPAEWTAATVAIRPVPPNPTPSTSSIDPSSVDEGSSEFDMTVNGSNFISSSVVRFEGSNRSTTFVSSTELTATIPSSDVDTAGEFDITVFNPSPGGGESNAQTLTVNEVGGDNPVPSISSISPTSKTAGSSSFTMTVNGSNFISDSVVRFEGSDRSTTFVSSSQLTATIPSSDLETAGEFDITVFNPTPGGGESAGKTFTVTSGGGGSGQPAFYSIIRFFGRAYPEATLTLLKRDESGAFPEVPVASDLPVFLSGEFVIEHVSIDKSVQKYALIATDKNGVSARSRFFEVDPTSSNSVNIDLPPTISLARNVVSTGSKLIVNGYKWPQGEIRFEIDGIERIDASITYGGDGSYRVEFNTKDLSIGLHNVRVRQTYAGGFTLSDYSFLKNFTVSVLSVVDADLNKDGRIDISDWSIFLFRWSSPDQALRDTIDFNADEKLDLSDFSIFVRTLKR